MNETMKTESKKTTTLHYVECVKYTAGQLDVAPFSAYVNRYVEVTFWKTPSDYDNDFDFVCKDESGKIIADGNDFEECKGFASYHLMNESRERAEALSLASQGAK
jgi:hypothetical protein